MYNGWIDTLNNPDEHALIKIVEKRRKTLERFGPKKLLRKLPTQADYSKIKYIQRTALYQKYKNSNDIGIEKWVFDNAQNAEYWNNILTDSLRGNYFTKPPRFQWVEDNNIYLISTRSAQQWFVWKDQLTKLFSNKTRDQLIRLYEPLRLKRFKKLHGSAHSTPVNDKDYLYRPEKGIHYSYFYFRKHHLKGEARRNANMEFPSKEAFRIVTFVPGVFTGKESFLSIKETLVEIQCNINDSALGTLDLVGHNKNELEELFGEPILEEDFFGIYGHHNRVLLVKYDKEKVNRFKYMRLNKSFELSDKSKVAQMKNIFDFSKE